MSSIVEKAKQRIYSLKHRHLDDFVFIHINKTGGSSVEKALNLPFEHKTAREKIAEIGRESWNKKLSFTVVRNPFDKVVSHYHYRIKTNQTQLGDKPIGFTEWVELAYKDKNPAYHDKPKMFMPQTEWINDENGAVVVNEIIYFENLTGDFNNVLQKIGKNTSLPHVKKSNHKNYKQYYDQATIDIVAAHFAQDLEMFNYSF